LQPHAAPFHLEAVVRGAAKLAIAFFPRFREEAFEFAANKALPKVKNLRLWNWYWGS
jgi:hypothetical protein